MLNKVRSRVSGAAGPGGDSRIKRTGVLAIFWSTAGAFAAPLRILSRKNMRGVNVLF